MDVNDLEPVGIRKDEPPRRARRVTQDVLLPEKQERSRQERVEVRRDDQARKRLFGPLPLTAGARGESSRRR